MTFKSKLGPGIVTFLSLTLIGATILCAVNGDWLALLFILLIIAFVVHMMMTTDYTIDGDRLLVRSGFVVRLCIEIESINKITETRSFISSPALSLDRLEIHYNKYDSILISPRQKQTFINELLRINSNISVGLSR